MRKCTIYYEKTHISNFGISGQGLIPALIGRHLSDTERQILSLPIRYGGVGIANPTKTSDREYEASKNCVTEDLVTLILNLHQDDDEIRCLNLSQEKGSSAWLTELPLKDYGFCLNK